MSFLTAALGAYGGYGQQKNANAEAQNRHQEFEQQQEQAQQQLDVARQQAEAEHGYRQAQLDMQKHQQTISNRAAGLDADGNPLPMPTGVQTQLPVAPPKGKAPDAAALASWARRNQAAALAAGRPDVADAYGSLANGYDQGATREANAALAGARGNELTQGKIPLEQAQANWWKGRHDEVMAGYKNKLQIANVETRGRMEAAANHVRAALASASNDQREFMAMQTAIGVANGQSEKDAFATAKSAADIKYRADMQIYTKGKEAAALGLGPDPGPAPTYNINVPSAPPPTVIEIPITLPDGTTRNVSVPRINTGNSGGGNTSLGAPAPSLNDPRLAPLQSKIAAARKRGVSDADILNSDEVKAALAHPAGAVAPRMPTLPVNRRPVLSGVNPAILGQ